MNMHYQTPVNKEDFEFAEKMQIKSFEQLNCEIEKEKMYN